MPKSTALTPLEHSITSFSGIQRTKVEAFHKERHMSPKSLRKKVNTFMENVVMKDPTATAIVFEELCKCLTLSFDFAEILTQPSLTHDSRKHYQDAQARPPLEA